MAKTSLGISGLYHDSAACIATGAEIIAAAQEERFTRKKHDPSFPANAINYCLEEAFIEADELDAVVFYDNPALTLDRVVRNFKQVGPQGREVWHNAARSILGTKLHLKRFLQDKIGYDGELWYVDHHLSHAASAFYPSPFEEAAILTVDGVGESATLTIGHGKGRSVSILKEIRYPHSLGLLYSAITQYCGFKVNSGEYKLMGLAPYGEPVHADLIKDHLIDIREDGSFALDMSYFAYMDQAVMSGGKLHELFGAPSRDPESRIDFRYMDIAASIQQVTEEVMLKLASTACRLTGSDNLTLAGGVALNCVANGKIQRSGRVGRLWMQPAAGDAGGALGAALYANHAIFGEPRNRPLPAGQKRSLADTQKGSLLGPAFSHDEIASFLGRRKAPFEQVADNGERMRRIAEALDSGMVVGHFAGRMEFGPRALGSRSIIGDPRKADMQSVMNLKIKYRESFRPFAPAVLYDKASDVFDLDVESPYMLLVCDVLEKLRAPRAGQPGSREENMLTTINEVRSTLPAITHVDYSARVQTVHPDDNPHFHGVLSAFHERTGCPVLINTSFNVRGEPIVNTPEDAYRCFMRTEMDLLVLEDVLVWKKDQPESEKDESWKTEFELD